MFKNTESEKLKCEEKEEEEAAEAAEAVAVSAVAVVSGETSAAREKCTRQFVQTAARNAKFHSSRQETGLYIAGNATESTRSSKFIFLGFLWMIFSFFVFFF
jgi:hypothetical protein